MSKERLNKSKDKRYAFVNGIILDGRAEMEPLSGKALLTEGDRIAEILPDTAVPTDCEIIDLKGAYLLPGLIDLHVHLALDGRPPKPVKNDAPVDYEKRFRLLTGNPLIRWAAKQQVAYYAKTEVMSGVTTVRTVGGVLDFDAEIRDEIKAGKRMGPRILAANTGISVPGGHFAGSIATAVRSLEEAERLVRTISATKPDLIKLMVTGGMMDSDVKEAPGALKMSPEIVRAACDEAHRLGYPVAAHVESSEGLEVALRNGVDTIEHGAKPTEEMIQLFRERKAADVCTLSPIIPYAEFALEDSGASRAERENGRIVLEGVIEGARACLENDIPVGLGSDTSCAFVLHYDFWREPYYFSKYLGRSAREALHRATLGNARIAGIGEETGSIEAGKCADLIVVQEDPLEDLSALRNVSMVMAGGRLIRHPVFKRMKEVDDLLDRYMYR